jgi:protein SCO1
MKSRYRNNIFLLVAALFLLNSCGGDPEHKLLLPVLGDKSLSGPDTVYHAVGGFTLTNQYGETITGESVKGKIRVANFFFATCQSICPEMSTNLTDVQQAFSDDPDVLILSHSVNPLHDTVEVLERYAAMYNAKKGKWHLLTGDKKMIYDLAKNSYLVNAVEDDGSEEGFLHSELLMLVDSQSRLRGMYDGTNKTEVKKLIEAVKLLKQEEKQAAKKVSG